MAQPTYSKSFAVITGASSGIGFELAKQFLENGFDILMTAEDSGLEQAALELKQYGPSVVAVKADLATYNGVDTLYKAIKDIGRHVDAIALNAGVGVGGDFTRDTDLKDEINMINLNVVAPVHLAKHIARDMVAAGKGRILFTSSVVAVMPSPYQAVYGATKAFLLSFSEALRYELKDTGVTVTALMPNATETNFFQRADLEDTKVGVSKKDDPALVAEQAFKALMDGKDHVLGGSLKSRLQGIMAEILPEPVKAGMIGEKSKPGSAHKSR